MKISENMKPSNFLSFYDHLSSTTSKIDISDFETIRTLLKEKIKQQSITNILYALIRYYNIKEYNNYTETPFQSKKLKSSFKMNYDLFPEKLQLLICSFLSLD